jgi:glutathione synthase/RimK-type ligase-like ATP-grasp enzyme
MAVLRYLERIGVPILNNYDSLEKSRDKFYTVQVLKENDLPIPKTMLARFPLVVGGGSETGIDKPKEITIDKEFKFPIILKKTSG